jgi:hypothetical protein
VPAVLWRRCAWSSLQPDLLAVSSETGRVYVYDLGRQGEDCLQRILEGHRWDFAQRAAGAGLSNNHWTGGYNGGTDRGFVAAMAPGPVNNGHTGHGSTADSAAGQRVQLVNRHFLTSR